MHDGLTYIWVLWRALAIFLLVGALFGAALGLLLIFRLPLAQGISRVANQWISTQRLELMLDRSISLEQWFQRNHKPAGMLIVLGALYILAYFGFQFDHAYATRQLSGALPAGLAGVLLDAGVLTAWVGAVLALFAGLVLWLRPESLRGVEARANRWISLQQIGAALDAPHRQVDDFVQRHAREAGWLLLVGSIYLFFLMFRTLV